MAIYVPYVINARLAAGSCLVPLLKAGAPVNAANKLGVTPLMEAAAKERLLSVEILVAHPGIDFAQVRVHCIEAKICIYA